MKVAFYTLGCKVNQYESNSLMEDFAGRGYSIVNHDEMADVYVVNTCTVTHLADRKSRQYIKRMKKLNPESIVAAIGCYAEINPDDLAAIEGVDIILGNKEKLNLPDLIEARLKMDEEHEFRGMGRNLLDFSGGNSGQTLPGDRTRALIKIQEGCNRFCSYCIIPYARGPVCSRSIEDIVEEAQNLLKKGYKELVLTGINTALYGLDFKSTAANGDGTKPTIENLVARLNDLPGDFRIRLGSLEPNVIDWQLAERLLKFDKLAHHMHLSMQSGSNRTLKSMNRRYQMKDFEKIIEVLRATDPDYGISTDIIVGFPGESDEDFQESLRAIRENKFVKTHAFPYSLREGTPAAKMPDQIDPSIKKARNAQMIKAGEESAREFLQGLKGKSERVLVEEVDGGCLVGHTGNFVKTYIKLPSAEAGSESYINTFVAVILEKVYNDGMMASLK